MADQKNQQTSQQNKNETNKQEQIKVEQPKTVDLIVVKVEENAAIIKLNGWRMRVYFEKSLLKEDREKISIGRIIKVNYFGDITNVHSIQLLPLKSVD